MRDNCNGLFYVLVGTHLYLESGRPKPKIVTDSTNYLNEFIEIENLYRKSRCRFLPKMRRNDFAGKSLIGNLKLCSLLFYLGSLEGRNEKNKRLLLLPLCRDHDEAKF